MNWKGAKIPDLSRISSVGNLLEGREAGVRRENLKATVVSDTTTKTEQPRGGEKEMYEPMEVWWQRAK